MWERERKRKQRIIIGSVTGIVVLLAAIYFGMAFYFNSHFFFRTKINGWKVGGRNLEKAEEKVGDGVEDYLLTVFDRDGEKHHIYGHDIACKYVPDGSVEKLLKEQSGFRWILAVFRPGEHEVPVTMEYEEGLISEAVKGMDCFQKENIAEPENAKIELGDDGYYVEPEKMGSHMIFEKVLEKVKQAVSAGDVEVTLSEEDYVNPEVTQKSSLVTDAMERIEKYEKAEITYEIKDYEEKLEKEKIRSFIQVGEDYSVALKEEEIEKYVQTLASTYNTYADVRSFQTSSGDTIEIGGGDYGWIVNKPGEAEQIKADLEAGKPVSREPVYAQRPFVEGKDDIGKTYIEIDYTKQHLWYYEEGALVIETDVVTGNISRNNGSPDGVFKIVYKDSPAVLKGEDYESNVEYFMPFAYNVGIHDASWRNGKFGGDIYKSSGSHGCINAPLEVATVLYEKVKVGTPVIAYYREPVELSAENAKISNAFSYVDPEKEKKEQE
ncbi:MAG: L,D-transpeptidase family protein [Lachnospiraceae bacterium]|nr:L,D-transpeptidase family protein [Lachnospiraceae bacterium]